MNESDSVRAAELELERLRQLAIQNREPSIGHILGVEVTVFRDGSSSPGLYDVIRAARRR